MTEHIPFNTTPLPLKLRVTDYLLLDEAGAFAGYGKTELIDGEIFYMNAQHRPHALTKSRFHIALVEALRSAGLRLEPLVEASIAMPDFSAPEPDIVLTSEPEGEGFIPLSSVALVIEVADASLAQDLGRKVRLYASQGVAEYWVVDVQARAICQLWTPEHGTYAQRRELAFGEPLAAVTIAGLTVATTAL